jgi:taurine dioxygenase
MSVEVRPLSDAVGAEIHGVDIGSNLGDAQLAEIVRAYGDFGVVFFRDQTLTPERHIRFARRFGEINVNRFFKPVDGYPNVAEVRKEPGQSVNIGGSWHTDHSYDQAPAMGSVLYALEVPRTGGDTLFASMYHAYEALSDGMKKALSGLKALHSSRHVFGESRKQSEPDVDDRLGNPDLAAQDAVHPVVIIHPTTGRKALYVNPGFTVRFEGWSDEDSKPLLEYLYEHASQPAFTCRFSWERGSVAFWDNRACWHYAFNDYHGQRRLMHRITIEGVPLGSS